MTELPKGWASGRLSDFIRPRSEKVHPANFPDLPFIGMDHVEAQTTKIVGSVPAGQMKSAAARFFRNDVIYGRLRPYLNKVAQPQFDGLASAEFIVFRGNALIDPAFLRHRLNARDFVSFASHLNEGDRPRVNFDQIGNFNIFVPPLNEQRRILDKLEELFDEIDRGVESLRAAKATLDLYRKSLLKSAFEGRLTGNWRARNPDKLESSEVFMARIRKERESRYQNALGEWERALAEWRTNGEEGKKPAKPKQPKTFEVHARDQSALPTTWVAVPLGNVAFEAVLGKMLDRQKNRGQPRPYLGNVNLRWGSFNVDPGKTIPIEDHEVPRYGVRAGDLIVCEGGEPGRCAVWEGDADRVFIQKALHRVRFTGSYSPMFAYYYFSFAAAAGLLEKHFTGSTIKHLTGTALAEVLLPVCSPLEQAEIACLLAGRFAAVDELQAEIQAALLRIELLRQSILKRAFSGQLVPQDPEDEPAAILLQRIKAGNALQMPTGTTRKRKARIA